MDDPPSVAQHPTDVDGADVDAARPDLRLVVPAVAAWVGSLWGLTHSSTDAAAAVLVVAT